jgi:hypothetical protein
MIATERPTADPQSKSSMKKIACVGSSVANFPDGFVLKYRFVSQRSDTRCFVRSFNFRDFRLDSRCRYRSDQGSIKAHTNDKRLWVWLSPPPPYSWATLVIGQQEDEGYVTGFSLKKSASIAPHKAVGIVRCFVPQPFPQLIGILRWRAPPLMAGTKFTLAPNPGYGITDFECSLALKRDSYQTRAACSYLRAGVRAGASVRLSRLRAEFAALWTESQLGLSGEFAIGALWRAGFQVFPSHPSHIALGAQRSTEWGYAKAALNFQRGTVSVKVKRVTPETEVSLVATGKRFGVGEWNLGFSVCRVAEAPPPPFARPNPHVPFRT